jgi:CHAT domain-containing protein/tetratricopeptide (TPR) repeat protein
MVPSPPINRPSLPTRAIDARRLACLVCLTCALVPAALPAQGPATTARELLTQADARLKAGQLLEADRLYRKALDSGAGPLRGRCFDGLILINAHLGRHDQTIQFALPYREELRKNGPAHRLREVTLQLGETYLALGHLQTAATYLRECLEVETTDPAPPSAVVGALASLARIAERQGDREAAGRRWQQLERFARGQLDGREAGLTPAEKIQCVWKLAEAYRFQHRPDRAITDLKALLPLHDRQDDPKGKRDTLRLLARQYSARRDPAEAEDCLRQALELHARADKDNELIHAELWNELADACQARGDRKEAEACRDRAVALYTSASKEAPPDQPALSTTTRAVWKLQQLYQRREQNLKALNFLEDQSNPWDRRAWMAAKLQAEKGSLLLVLGSYEKARALLRQAVEGLEAQSPLNLVDLPRALLALAIVEQATGQVERAETLGRRGLELYQQFALPDDVTLAETHDLLGTCQALRGEYAQAIEYFRTGLACCTRLGSPADRQHSNLLLNVGLLHKSQGDLDDALRCCEQARNLTARFAEPDSLEVASLQAALADLLDAGGQYREADTLAEGLLKLCERRHISAGPLVVTARHSQALYHLYRGRYGEAEEGWLNLLALQEKEKQLLLVPRTLNYLGVTAEKQGHLETAEKYYRRALALQEDNVRAFPATHFISLWRLANIAERQGKRNEAIGLLERGLPIVEAVRLRTYGDAQQRAAFFAQFAMAFEQLVDWDVKAGRLEDAIVHVARTRSRTLLDQLQLAGIDPRESLTGPRGEELRRQEDELRRQISAIRARAQFLAPEDEDREANKLDEELSRAQQDYAAVWREILNASPSFRTLIGPEQPGKLLASLRDKVLGPRTALLTYYLGEEHGFLLLLGDRSRSPEVFPLTVSPKLLTALAALSQPGGRDREGGRGIVVKPRKPEVPKDLANAPTEAAVPLTRERARFLVETYREHLEDPNSPLTRGIRVVPRDPARPGARADSLGDVFVPPAVRQRLREWGLDQVVVVPDGALHKLPLEALPLESKPKPRYLIDELPPLVYAPSPVVLALRAEQPRPARPGPLSLLTVGNPAYAQKKDGAGDAADPAAKTLLGLRGQLPLLPFTAEESRRIRQHFDAGQVLNLEGEQATEEAVRAAVAGRRILHLAAHGFADERFGNLFGALALAPPAPGKESAENDGFLSLHEIYGLPLQDCELAVLSACETNAGPQRPLEAGVTLASGFLTAGARRVVASHWSVDDKSTAELMSAFFAEGNAAASRGEAISYAAALQKARLAVRGQRQWASPFYWAPFVLIGPPDNGTGK